MLVAGAAGGLLAGLLGVGGGIVIVPVLYFVLTGLGVEDEVRMKLAVATSLATIIFTSMSSMRSHNARQAVDVGLAKRWSVPIVAGVLTGTVLAGLLPGAMLTAVFSVVAMAVSLRMLLTRDGSSRHDGFPNRVVEAFCGYLVGWISSLMGIGGGTISVPILRAFGYDIRLAVGTASALGFMIAIPGTLGYIAIGWNVPGLPSGSLGYVNLIALSIIIPVTMLTAPFGARLAHVIPRQSLGYAFALFLAMTAIRMGYDTAVSLGLL